MKGSLCQYLSFHVILFQRFFLKVRVPTTYFLSEELAKERILGFSDGVFSIAMTLIVLDIDVPQSDDGSTPKGDNSSEYKDLKAVMTSQWDQYIAYLISFVVVSLFWVSSNMMFEHLKRLDLPMRTLNTAVLACVGTLGPPGGLGHAPQLVSSRGREGTNTMQWRATTLLK